MLNVIYSIPFPIPFPIIYRLIHNAELEKKWIVPSASAAGISQATGSLSPS